jgi:hypothetical protein
MSSAALRALAARPSANASAPSCSRARKPARTRVPIGDRAARWNRATRFAADPDPRSIPGIPRAAPSDTVGVPGITWASMTEEQRYEEAYDMIVRLATTLNAYEHVAFTSRATNMGVYVYESLSRVPEEHRGLLVNELTDRGLENCWFIAGLLYKIKLAERESSGGPMDVSSDLDAYQDRLDRAAAARDRFRRIAGDSTEDAETDAETEDDDDYVVEDSVDEGTTNKTKTKMSSARREKVFAAGDAGVQVFEGRAANVPGGPLLNRFQKVFYPAPGVNEKGEMTGVWNGRVVVKKPRFIEKALPLYFSTNDTLAGRFLKVPATAEDADVSLDYQNIPYLESDMPPAMRYPSRRTPGVDGDDVWWPIPKIALPPFDTLVDYIRPLGPGVYAGKGWRGGGKGAEFLTFLLFRRVDVTEEDLEALEREGGGAGEEAFTLGEEEGASAR